jgi:hypothetical protein
MKSLRLHLALRLLIASASPVFSGVLIQFDAQGNGNDSGTPLVATFLADGGIEYQCPPGAGGYQTGDELIYDSEGTTLSDILKSVSSNFATGFFFYSLDSGGLAADTLTPPALNDVFGNSARRCFGQFSLRQ